MLFERHQGGERAILVHVQFQHEDLREELREARELIESAGALVVATVETRRQVPDARTFVGSGKAEHIAQLVEESQAEILIVNHSLSPTQERNLERLCRCRVLDRTGLILDIFAQRARSHEGKLQVELAQLRYMQTRLVRGWTHLERQQGGLGLRGPGEKQLETDRRLIGQRVQRIRRRLQRVQSQRTQSRKARTRNAIPSVALAGYTNAGKSTLFNQLGNADVQVADQLFATLDPSVRLVQLEGGIQATLSDTVGFIRHLPHGLVEAFRSTLQETAEADLLLLVLDAADSRRHEMLHAVNSVLRDIGAADIPQLLVLNKADQCGVRPGQIEPGNPGEPERIWISALDGTGIDRLRERIAQRLRPDLGPHLLHLPYRQAHIHAELCARQAIRNSRTDDQGWHLQVFMPEPELRQLLDGGAKHSENRTDSRDSW